MKLKSGRAWLSAPALLLLLATGSVWAQTANGVDDIARGKRLYMRCAACHDIGDSGPPRIGPHLKGLVGRPAGSVAGYQYSPAMKAKPFPWDEKQLDAWLVKPSAVVPGTTMAFAGMPDEAERKALISYMKTLK